MGGFFFVLRQDDTYVKVLLRLAGYALQQLTSVCSPGLATGRPYTSIPPMFHRGYRGAGPQSTDTP